MKKTALTLLQKNILAFFADHSFGTNFYWTGGTLLASQYLHHRQSFDLDLFSDNLFADLEYISFIQDLKKTIKIHKIIETRQHNRQTYFLRRPSESLKLELVFFPFPNLKKRAPLPGLKITADSLTDAMVNKTLAVYQRSEPKDIYDMYCYLTREPEHSLFQLLGLVEKKFGVSLETPLWLTKAQELTKQLNIIKPILVGPSKGLVANMQNFFQKIFNNYAGKKIT